jgi:hypothetical protein
MALASYTTMGCWVRYPFKSYRVGEAPIVKQNKIPRKYKILILRDGGWGPGQRERERGDHE